PEVSPPSQGVLLTQLTAGSNAAQSGLKLDDVLLAYAGTKLNDAADLRSAIEAQQKAPSPGTERTEAGVPVQVWRAAKVVDLAVRPGPLGVQVSERPAAETLVAKRAADRALQTSRDSTFAPLPGTRL